MEYTHLELMTYILIYSFLGWVFEVCLIAIKEKRFCNRGFLNFPFNLSYGLIMGVLIVVLPTQGNNYTMQMLTIFAISSAGNYLAGGLSKRISKRQMWRYESYSIYGGELRGGLRSTVIALGFAIVYYLLHPIIFFLIELVPYFVITIITNTVTVILIIDFMAIIYAVRTPDANYSIVTFESKTYKKKTVFSKWIYEKIWQRIYQAYPMMKECREEKNSNGKAIFAKGICLDKTIWIFLICALGGDIVETLYCRLTAGVWMSRSSVIYGPFSLVWGIGAAVLTVVLHRLTDKEDRYIFIVGAMLGGVYEYICSVFTEVFLGTTFWDYSWMPFNIGGRTNLLYCIFWGIIAVFWMKLCYPRISTWIERIPPIVGKVLTWTIMVLMICNTIISAVAMNRYTQRQQGVEANNKIETFLDNQYPNELIEKVWPNMILHMIE